ncbi:Protease IV [Paramagnetospirillum magnetotacticum MS-1]|uniref:Protease IV n=1 Tax=Paramagnetospirillum magnetotacticum MS-1 TaxID=272627 RepID=A0A0C2V5A9_PARME|nr:signal peptide peptidase SppA [Paramagnetospirillum magnetotacticum]KIM00257.1 Protease IV [Paramagnetospirillum magnetotacticum MS-1]
MRRIGRVLVAFLAVSGFVFLGLMGLGIWAGIHMAEGDGKEVPERVVLTLDLDAPFRDTGEANPLAQLSGERSYGLRQTVEALDRAALDSRVTGLFATMGHSSLGLAGRQDLRDAVIRFRASGKSAVLFAETMGEGGSGTLDYYLAAAFSQVWLQPSGDVGLTGLWVESPFIKGTLDLLGMKAQFSGRHEYKSAIDMFTETGFTPAHRENLGRLLDSWSEQIISGIAANRGLPEDRVRDLMGKGPFLASEALNAKLVDKVGYRDQAWEIVAGIGTDKAEDMDLADYAGHLDKARGGAKIALISGIGAIHRGESRHGLDGDGDFGAQTVAEAFRDAVDDDKVKAILFRVDSPGGSYTASDTVHHEVARARAAGKPVVVSMGNYAASGGYFVAMGADRIIAAPGTITGSIGVFTGKVVLEDFWKKLGISWDQMQRGDNAGIWSANQPFTPQAKARIDALLDHIYADFTGKASQARNLDAARMDKLARGRVWTGADAKESGLVDGLGGWTEALAQLRQVAGLKADEPLSLVEFPRPRKPWEVLAESLGGGGVAERRILSRIEPLLNVLSPVPGAQLRAPDLRGPR